MQLLLRTLKRASWTGRIPLSKETDMSYHQCLSETVPSLGDTTQIKQQTTSLLSSSPTLSFFLLCPWPLSLIQATWLYCSTAFDKLILRTVSSNMTILANVGMDGAKSHQLEPACTALSLESVFQISWLKPFQTMASFHMWMGLCVLL